MKKTKRGPFSMKHRVFVHNASTVFVVFTKKEIVWSPVFV